MHVSSHEDMVLLGLRSLKPPSFIRVRQRVVRRASNVFASACISSLRWFDLRLFMCLLMQHDSR